MRGILWQRRSYPEPGAGLLCSKLLCLINRGNYYIHLFIYSSYSRLKSSTIIRLTRLIRTDPETCSCVTCSPDQILIKYWSNTDEILIKEFFDVLPMRAAQEVLAEQLRIIFSIIEAIVVFYKQMGHKNPIKCTAKWNKCPYYCLWVTNKRH